MQVSAHAEIAISRAEIATSMAALRALACLRGRLTLDTHLPIMATERSYAPTSLLQVTQADETPVLCKSLLTPRSPSRRYFILAKGLITSL